MNSDSDELLTSQKAAFSLEEKLEKSKFWTDRLADFLTHFFGTVQFLLLNAIVFAIWVLVNLGGISSIPVFDPYPFGLLTMLVSLEAIILATVVLITQNRLHKVDSLREELDFIVTLQAEEESTRILKMLDEIHDHLGLNPNDDHELRLMKKRTDVEKLRKMLLKRIPPQ
jgi:uncharacterized membrane protein